MYFKSLYHKSILLCILWMIGSGALRGQELFPLSEPASTMPKGVVGLRLISETYKERPQWRNMTAIRLMYGITGRWTVYATAIGSNHHGEKMPPEYPFHNTPERGAQYPYKMNGVHLYTKYRFHSIDKKNFHWRNAFYVEGTWVNTTHHESEPDLMMGDTKGWGGGLISTLLINKLAVSATLGYIHPLDKSGFSPDVIASLPDVPVRTTYGKTLTYGLSFGYLLFPRQYKSYEQLNFNIYLEGKGKWFDDAYVLLNEGLETEYYLQKERYPNALRRGAFLDISGGIQAIIKSNLRIDGSLTFPAYGTSFARLYPVYTLGIQYFLNFK